MTPPKIEPPKLEPLDLVEDRSEAQLIADGDHDPEHAKESAEREELRFIVSYLGHHDQDANHAWMARRIRAVLAGRDPSKVEPWSAFDGVRKPTSEQVVVKDEDGRALAVIPATDVAHNVIQGFCEQGRAITEAHNLPESTTTAIAALLVNAYQRGQRAKT